ALLGTQALAGLVSLVVSSIVLKRCGTLYFHINCKILIAALLIIFIIHSVLFSGLQGMHLFRYLTISDPCEVMVRSVVCFSVRFPVSVCTTSIILLEGMHLFRYLTISDPCEVLVRSAVCFSMRYPASTCTTSIILLELSMIIERAIALWKRSKYDSFGPKIGLTLTATSVLISVLSCAWGMSEEDFSQRYAYCTSVTAKTTKNMMVLIFACAGISASTICGAVILYITNSFAKKREHFDLNTSYQLCENENVLRLLLPLDIFQATISVIATTSGFIILIFRDQLTLVSYRVLLASINLFPYYTIISPTLLWFIIRWSRRLKADKMDAMMKKRGEADNDIYFRTYREMWGISRKIQQ
ncbi:hypothetical protein V3C99_012714, partial [Haemonchus contortus]|uniref:G protein-coupled receptor n=1 Tax=Haemonchus contortus TaxID=6289 RepID=A0A7I4Y4E1_HAECO